MYLPKELDPVKACKAHHVFKGSCSAPDFLRLTDVIQDLKRFEYDWAFFVDNKVEMFSTLKFKACVVMLCQRCQRPVDIAISENVLMKLVFSVAEAEGLPVEIQALCVEKESLLETLVALEDELMLALPMIPLHAEKDCYFSQNQAYYEVHADKNTHKPFADLSKIMNSKE